MTVTGRGQITIPKALRERFALLPGTEVEFVAEDDGLRLKPSARRKKGSGAAAAWLAKASGSIRTAHSTDQIMAVTRGED